MSLLLDALRKSEDQRRKGELPPLDQPLSSGPVMATQARGARLRSVLIALLILIALIIAAWWWLNRPQPDSAMPSLATNAETVSELTSEPTRSAAEALVMQDEAPAETGVQLQSPSDERATAPTATSSESSVEPSIDNRLAERQPSTTEQDIANVPASDAGQATQSEADSVVAETESSEVETIAPAQVETAPERRVSESESAESLLQNPLEATSNQAEVEIVVEPEPISRSFIYAWELPLEARQDFPDLDVAVHVFATEPGNRFVLINGERYGQGDRLAPGVVLSEITRQGALVDFRNYRILLQ